MSSRSPLVSRIPAAVRTGKAIDQRHPGIVALLRQQLRGTRHRVNAEDLDMPLAARLRTAAYGPNASQPARARYSSAAVSQLTGMSARPGAAVASAIHKVTAAFAVPAAG